MRCKWTVQDVEQESGIQNERSNQVAKGRDVVAVVNRFKGSLAVKLGCVGNGRCLACRAPQRANDSVEESQSSDLRSTSFNEGFGCNNSRRNGV